MLINKKSDIAYIYLLSVIQPQPRGLLLTPMVFHIQSATPHCDVKFVAPIRYPVVGNLPIIPAANPTYRTGAHPLLEGIIKHAGGGESAFAAEVLRLEGHSLSRQQIDCVSYAEVVDQRAEVPSITLVDQVGQIGSIRAGY